MLFMVFLSLLSIFLFSLPPLVFMFPKVRSEHQIRVFYKVLMFLKVCTVLKVRLQIL